MINQFQITPKSVFKITVLKALMVTQLCSFTSIADINEEHALPYYSEKSFQPHWFATVDMVPKTFHKIPDFSLTNQNGETVTQLTFDRKIYVASFFFTSCPGICPRMQSQLSTVNAKFENNDNVAIVSHSITPKIDTIAKLEQYAKEKNISNTNWHLLTGDRAEIYRLAKEFYFADEDLGENSGDDDFLHTESLVLIDPNKHIRGIYNGLNATSVNHLINDIKRLEREFNI